MSHATETAPPRWMTYVQERGAEILRSNIAALCARDGITKRHLFVVLGIGTASASNWKNHAPNVWVVLAIADYFGVTAEALMTDPELILKAEAHRADR